MKRVAILIIISLFLIGFICAGMTSKTIDENNQTDKNKSSKNSVEIKTENKGDDTQIETRTRLTEEQIKNITATRNRIRIEAQNKECPEACECTGTITKCQLKNGTREMTIVAGNSGNIIMQVKEVNASTNVTLYKSNGNIYGMFKGNKTRIIRMLPDQVKERIRERLSRILENETITLNEDGAYDYQAEKPARLFFLFPVTVRVNAELNPETGDIISIKNSWWSFLAKDEGEQILGASCGTVTPGQNDACCINKGYDIWNSDTGECQFNTAE